MPQILSHFPSVNLALAGDGELRKDLEEEAGRLGIRSAVRFLGYRNDVPDLLAGADIVVQPSHMEGLCSSLIDTMLAARPVVATRAGGIPELLDVTHGNPEVAWLVPPKSPDALAKAVLAALGDEVTATKRGQFARERALQKFTASKMVHGTLFAYANVARQRYLDQAASRIPALRPFLESTVVDPVAA